MGKQRQKHIIYLIFTVVGYDMGLNYYPQSVCSVGLFYLQWLPTSGSCYPQVLLLIQIC